MKATSFPRTGVLVLGSLLTLAPACIRSADVAFANPCAHEIRITTYDSPHQYEGGETVTVTLPPRVVTLVDDAFHGDPGSGWSLRVDGWDERILLDEKLIVDDTVVLPAEICRQSQAPEDGKIL